jgi:hypothetical protein
MSKPCACVSTFVRVCVVVFRGRWAARAGAEGFAGPRARPAGSGSRRREPAQGARSPAVSA